MLAHRQPDTVRVNRLNSLALLLRSNSATESATLFRQALALATRLHYARGQADALFGLGYYYREQSRYVQALNYTQQAHQLYVRLQDRFNETRAIYGLTRIYFEQGLYGQSLAANLAGLQLARTEKLTKPELFLRIQHGLTSTALGEYDQARRSLLRALGLAKQLHDAIGYGHAYTALGELSEQQQQWARAQYYYTQALRSYQPVYNEQGLLPTRINLVKMDEYQGRAAQALAQGRVLLREARTTREMARLQLVLSRAFLRTGQLDSAQYYGMQSLRLSRTSNLKEEGAAAATLLARAGAQQGDFVVAYRYQREAGAYADSLTGNATRRRVAALQFRAEQEQEASQRRELAQQQELADLRQHQQQAILAVLALLAGGIVVWTYKRRQRLHEETLRKRLAADLHDDVGTLLSQIALQSGLLQEGLADVEGQREQLNQIADASRTAVRQLNDVVWSLDAHNDHLPDLLDRMRDYAYEVLPPAGFEVTFEVPAALPEQRLPVLLRRNLYLIYKEALHNILKHARQANQVTIGLYLPDPGRLVLNIADNGQPATSVVENRPYQHQRRTGHGLRNISQRAAAVGGEAIASMGPTGFRLRVQMPLT